MILFIFLPLGDAALVVNREVSGPIAQSDRQRNQFVIVIIAERNRQLAGASAERRMNKALLGC